MNRLRTVLMVSVISIVIGLVSADLSEGSVTYWSVDDLNAETQLTTSVYPPLPPETYEISYDTEPNDATWGPISTSVFPQHLRVRFTPEVNGQLVREARIKWAGPWGGNNQFEIHIVDVNTGTTEKTPVLSEPDPWDWKVYDVSEVGFYTNGDFYIELWAIDCEIGVYVDDTPPVYNRLEVNIGNDWFYPQEWVESDFRIRAIVSTNGGDPDIDVSPTSLEITLPPDTTGELVLTINNVGGADLVVSNICDEEVVIVKGAKVTPINAEEMEVDGGKAVQGTLPSSLTAEVSDEGELPCEGTRHDLATENHWGQGTGPGSGRAIGFHADSNFTISSVGIMAALTPESFDVLVYDSPDGHSVGNVLYTTSYTTGGEGYGWYDMPVDFTFTAGNYYVLNWRPTDGGFNDWVESPGLDYYHDNGLPYTVGPLTIVEGFEGYNAEDADNFLHPHLRICSGGLAPCACDPDAPWMSVDPTSGTVNPGNSMEVTVSFDTAGMSEGTYNGNIKIASNDPDEPCVVVPVTLNVGCPTPGCEEDDSGALDIGGSAGTPGGTVTIPVRIQGAPNVVESLGFEVTFNTCVLEYTGFTPGPLVENFDYFDAFSPATGIVRVGGFEAGEDTIDTGASGVVVYLNFNVIECEQAVNYALDLQELKDDIASWSTSLGCFQCGACDINGDGEVTPQDALCCFQKYLGICPTSCGPCEEISCDVNGDGDTTPADALEIFKEYLGLPSACSQ